MNRYRLTDLAVFVEVARCRGFRSAAEKLGLTPGAVSEAVKRCENSLGVRLLERTTRSVALTAPGEFLLKKSLGPLQQLDDAIAELNDQSSVVSGVLRISAPRRAGHFFLDALLIKYGLLYPEVRIDILYDDKKIDFVAEGFDIAVRAQTLVEEDTYAFPIGPAMPMTVVASPRYLKKHGAPAHPKEIVNHDGICFAFERSEKLAPWEFVSRRGIYSAMPKPRIVVNDMGSLLEYCLEGMGLAYTFAEPTQTLIKERRLSPVLSKHMTSLSPFSINYVTKRHMPRRVKAFIELAKQQRY